MALLADEHTGSHRHKPAGREYLYFAVVLIALLLAAGAQSVRRFDSNSAAISSP